jgi:hypothetical protein
LFLAGSWDARGAHLRDGKFSVTCTSGAIGKCVRAGYRPWEAMADGRPGWDHHQACTRLIRADYCGDGASHTRDGTLIEIIDRLGEGEEPGTGLAFEAGWGAPPAAHQPRSASRDPSRITAEPAARVLGRPHRLAPARSTAPDTGPTAYSQGPIFSVPPQPSPTQVVPGTTHTLSLRSSV